MDKEIDMNTYRKGLYAAVFSAVLAGVMGPAFAASADDSEQPSNLERQVDAADAAVTVSQSLKGIVVTPNNNPLLRSDQRLALLTGSLPLDVDSSAVQPTELQRLEALFPHNPEAATGEARRMIERSRTQVSGGYGAGEP
jgi:hypothetical protein